MLFEKIHHSLKSTRSWQRQKAILFFLEAKPSTALSSKPGPKHPREMHAPQARTRRPWWLRHSTALCLIFLQCLRCLYFIMLSCSVMSDSLWPPWSVAHQAPLSMGFSRQEDRSGLPFPSPRGLLMQGSNRCLLPLLHWYMVSLSLVRPGKPTLDHSYVFC